MSITDFHFLRPGWLLLLLPLAAILFGLLASQRLDNQWQKWVDSRLLSHLLDKQQQKANRWPLWALAAAWLIATLATAGPTWEKLPQPVMKKEQSLVILWDLSPSMLARDLKPDRLTRARYKLMDLLKAKHEGEAALVVYAGEAYVVTPLSDDMDTIIAQLPALEPGLMPVRGSNTEMAVETAIRLFKDASVYAGDILLVTDGVVPEAIDTISNALASTQHTLSVLAVGTETGAPVPIGDGFAKDSSGKVIVDQLNIAQLQGLAERNGGKFTVLRSDNLDVEYLLADQNRALLDSSHYSNNDDEQHQFDIWQEQGPYLVLLLLPFAALAFRRGWLLTPLLAIGLATGYTPTASALEWQDLWQTHDQRAMNLLEQGKSAEAAQLFDDPAWAASAHYKNGDYDQAASLFDPATPEGLYNQGNALAQAGQLQEALAAYDKALAANPNFEDAQYNRDVVEKRLQQQQNSQSQKQNQQNDSDQNQEQSDQQDGQSSNQDQSQQSEQQDGDQQQADNEQQNDSSSQQSADNQSQQNTENKSGRDEQQSADRDSNSEQNGDQNQADQMASADESQSDEEQSDADNSNASAALANDDMSEEQRQALEQWLKQIPDDPSGLLRRKFQHQYRQRRQEYRAGEWHLPSNNAASRL
ncbi:vWA domain-containing protein [Halioxenophilus sp. WMMB6]|uniref:vWA domain-containing protein n=1 Tax=Halioxenophilus sp. WMMB6 TaxID=3073815 RepID=UPI00295F2CD7|nr:VWA domain-containing protein [Halioxenophilus sp. WMMB6]